jgi:hypothetical protein
LKKDQIVRLASRSEEAEKSVDVVSDVYDELSDEQWARHRTPSSEDDGKGPSS